MQELSRQRAQAAPLLRKALEKPASEEARRRLPVLVKRLDEWLVTDREELRHLRAVWILETAATPAARRVLERLAGGTPAARLTHEARAALGRLPPHTAP